MLPFVSGAPRRSHIKLKMNCPSEIKIGYLIVIHEAAVNLATFVAFLIGVDKRILLTRRGFSPLTKTFTN